MQSKIQKFKLLLFLMLILPIFFTSESFACVGARPLGMGGAFVAVADDVNAIYWNPAGLAQIKDKQITWMHTVNNRKEINYQDFYGFTQSLKDISIGIGYIHSIPHREEEKKDDEKYRKKKIHHQRLYYFSAAKRLNEKSSLGVSIRQNEEEIKTEEWWQEPQQRYEKYSKRGDAISIDLGFLHKIDEKLTFGVLIQDVNEPEIEIKHQDEKVEKGKYIRNIRPGFAYKVTENFLIATDIYFFTLDDKEESEKKKEIQSIVKAGFEFQANENWALRAGMYGKTHTMGFGYKKDAFQIDYALLYMPYVTFDITIFEDKPVVIPKEDHIGVHLLSITWKF